MENILMDVKPINKGNLKAQVDLTLITDLCEVEIRRCKLIETNGHLWLAFPTETFKAKDGKTQYLEIFKVPKSFQKQLEELAVKKFKTIS